MKLVKEIEILINDLLDNDQPTDEIARQILNLIRNKDIGITKAALIKAKKSLEPYDTDLEAYDIICDALEEIA